MQQSNSGGNAATERQAPVHLFDTAKLVNLLEEAEVPRVQAEARVEAIRTAVSGTVATKADLEASESRIEAALAKMEARMIRWFVGSWVAVVALIIALG